MRNNNKEENSAGGIFGARLKRAALTGAQAGLAILFPPACPVCGKPLGVRDGKQERLHEACQKRLVPVREPRCLICGKPLEDDRQERCLDCQKRRHEFKRSLAVFEYNDAAKDCIYRFKYKNKREYADTLGFLLWTVAERRIRAMRPDVIIPVPMHQAKQKKRGYNQAELLARSLSRYSKIPEAPDALLRIRATRPMKELTAHERYSNLNGAFAVNRRWVREDSERLAGVLSASGQMPQRRPTRGLPWERVLLLDDIYTSGTTLDMCSRALKQAGVKEVYGICLCVGAGF